MARRIVVQHPDGRRVSVDEDEFEGTPANPFNFPSTVVEDTGRSYLTTGRPADDHQSLRDEGFEPVAYIHGEQCDERCTHTDNFVLHAAGEQCIETVLLPDGRMVTIARVGHQEHLEDPDTVIIHPGHEIPLEAQNA